MGGVVCSASCIAVICLSLDTTAAEDGRRRPSLVRTGCRDDQFDSDIGDYLAPKAVVRALPLCSERTGCGAPGCCTVPRRVPGLRLGAKVRSHAGARACRRDHISIWRAGPGVGSGIGAGQAGQAGGWRVYEAAVCASADSDLRGQRSSVRRWGASLEQDRAAASHHPSRIIGLIGAHDDDLHHRPCRFGLEGYQTVHWQHWHPAQNPYSAAPSALAARPPNEQFVFVEP